jgi:hypothetical protein
MHWYDWAGSIFGGVLLATLLLYMFANLTQDIYGLIERRRIRKGESTIPYYDQLTRDDGWTSNHTKDLEAEIYKTPLDKLIDQAVEREEKQWQLDHAHLEPRQDLPKVDPGPAAGAYRVSPYSNDYWTDFGRPTGMIEITPINGPKQWIDSDGVICKITTDGKLIKEAPRVSFQNVWFEGEPRW